MENQLREWLFDPTVGKLVASLVAIIVTYSLVKFLQRSSSRVFTDSDTRYRIRKLIAFFGYVAAGLVIANIYSARLVPHDFYVRAWEQVSDDARGFYVEEDSGLKVRDIMTPMIFSVSVDASLAEMADTMVGGRVHRLIVTDGKEVVGIVTTLDMIKAFRDETRGVLAEEAKGDREQPPRASAG